MNRKFIKESLYEDSDGLGVADKVDIFNYYTTSNKKSLSEIKSLFDATSSIKFGSDCFLVKNPYNIPNESKGLRGVLVRTGKESIDFYLDALGCGIHNDLLEVLVHNNIIPNDKGFEDWRKFHREENSIPIFLCIQQELNTDTFKLSESYIDRVLDNKINKSLIFNYILDFNHLFPFILLNEVIINRSYNNYN